MEFKTNIDSQQFDNFVSNHPFTHYMKTSLWANNQKALYPLNHRVGMVENNQILATALILERKRFGCRYFYIPWGPCVDYTNIELTKIFLQAIHQFAKSRKVDFIRLDPNVLRVEREINGQVSENGLNQEYIRDYLIELGYLHKGYGYAYNGSWTNRFTLIIKLHDSMDSIVSHFTKSRQNILKRQNILGISVNTSTIKELNYLCLFEEELAKIQGFKPHEKGYFEALMNDFSDHAHYYLVSMNLNHAFISLQEEIDSNKYAKDPQALISKQNELKLIQDLIHQYGSKVVIAAGLFIQLNQVSWDLYTYNRKDFSTFKAVDYLHRYVIEQMKQQGVLYYDMCGFSGVIDKADPHYGLYDYKRSFGSTYTEYIGQFDDVLSPIKYKGFLKILHYTNRYRQIHDHKANLKK